MRTFFCDTIGDVDDIVHLKERDSKHLFKTLRGASGDELKLMDGKGTVAQAVITGDGEVAITGKVLLPIPDIKLHLYIAPPRKQKMDQLLKQATEVGIWSITPIFTERSVAIPDKHSVFDRWETLLIEGCKQSSNAFIPQIHHPMKLKEAITSLDLKHGDAYFGTPHQEGDKGFTKSSCKKMIYWFVGPEGGFTGIEESVMCEHGIYGLKIGNSVMRVETAAICGASLLLFQHNNVH